MLEKRRWLTLLGMVAGLAVLLPPAGTLARHYVFAQALQFAVLATVTPALIVLGSPGRGTWWRPAIAWLTPVGFIAIAVGWRLPVAVNALVRYPVLTLLEAATLIGAGCLLWRELVESRSPRGAAFAALPMWVIWASAYIMAFSHTVWFTAFAHRPGSGLGVVVDQQIAAGLLWAIPGLCFVPVVYVSLITWLRDTSDSDVSDPAVPLVPRPPRGWRLNRY